jgi:hypothetical protein
VACAGAFDLKRNVMASRMRRETKQIGAFVARNQSGKKHRLLIFVEFRYQKDNSGKESVTRGPVEIETEDGDKVDALGQGDYRVIRSGIKLHSDDPDAPK